jgi:hypothetical protein
MAAHVPTAYTHVTFSVFTALNITTPSMPWQQLSLQPLVLKPELSTTASELPSTNQPT